MGARSPYSFQISKKAIRIISLSKYNAHTEPLFINLKLLKISDLFKFHCLVLHYKIERGLAPSNIRSLIIRNTDIHTYHTRQYTIRQIAPNFKTHADSMRYYLPVLINSMPGELLQNIFFWQLQTFKKHLKIYFLNQYSAICTIPQCIICGRNRLL